MKRDIARQMEDMRAAAVGFNKMNTVAIEVVAAFGQLKAALAKSKPLIESGFRNSPSH